MMRKICLKIFFKLKALFDILFGYFTIKKGTIGLAPKAYLIGTPEHDNLGDHAIALSEEQFIQKNFKEYEIIEITVENWRKYVLFLYCRVKKEDIFFLTGGGNLGDIYLPDEKLRRFIIKKFKKNNIIVFPQTIFFTDTKKGKRELDKTRKIYNQHKKLLICAREQISYDIMKKYFSAKIFLCPDMVFGLEIKFSSLPKRGVVGVCLRNDCEKVEAFDPAEIPWINDFKIENFSTCNHSGIKKTDRYLLLVHMLEQISSYDFVLTDRLHAMIFSYIAQTICVVVPSKGHKINGTLEWLSGLESVFKVSNIKDQSNNGVKQIQPKRMDFNCYFEKLAKIICEMIE